MIKISDKSTYCFEGIHIPRIYINDAEKVKRSLNLLHKHGSLTLEEMTAETQRVRSEDIREIFYLLWRLGFGIDVSKKGRKLVFLSNDKLESFVALDNSELKNIILEKLKLYNPFIAVLDNLIHYKRKGVVFIEKDITYDFHNGRVDGGRIDNTHPLLRWSKDEDWDLVINKQITKRGIDFIKQSKALGIHYFHHTVDLNASKELNIITYILSSASFEEIEKVTYDEIVGLIKTIQDISKNEVLRNLEILNEKGLPIILEPKSVHISNKIYHELTPKLYTKFKLHLLDGIAELKPEESPVPPPIEEENFKKSMNGIKTIIITDEELDLNNYPQNSKVITYEYLIRISDILPNIGISNIILAPGWKPLKVSKIGGILLAFVRLGGNLIIFQAPGGRIGSNRNIFNWLPYDLSRISFVFSDHNEIKGYFTFPFEEQLTYTSIEKYEKFVGIDKKYSLHISKYYKGKIIFSGYEPSISFFTTKIEQLEKEFVIDPESVEWKYKDVPSINRLSKINTEYDLYPLLREIMNDNFNFEFDPEITGKVGQTDIFITEPFFCCCEVTPPRTNATGFPKVSEVNSHRENMVYKNGKVGKKRFGDNEVGACVFGPSFTIEAGVDKSGAVDTAKALRVTLISYIDLYELICLNARVELTNEDLVKIFFYEEEKPEASLKIYELIEEKLIR